MILKFEETSTNTLEANYAGFQVIIEKNKENIFGFKIIGEGKELESKAEQCSIELEIVKKEAEKVLLKAISLKMWKKQKTKFVALIIVFLTVGAFLVYRQLSKKTIIEKSKKDALLKLISIINELDEFVTQNQELLNAQDIKEITDNLKTKCNEFIKDSSTTRQEGV